MQINKINNTSFGMALKIDKGLKSELQTRPAEFINTLEKLGEKIADIKNYHVCFEEGRGFDNPTIRSTEYGRITDYLAGLRHEEKKLGQYYELPTGMAGESIGGFFPEEPHAFRKLYGNNAATEYKKFKTLNKYDQAAEFTRVLEQLEFNRISEEKAETAKKAAEEAAAIAKTTQQEAAVDNILSKYENDFAPIAQDEKTQTFWDKIVNLFK